MPQFEDKPERPPYVIFETRAVEDRTQTLESGKYATKDVDFAVITPQGSKDCIDRVASEWLDMLDAQVREQRIPQQWATAFRGAYKAWKEGREMPLEGTSVKNWSVASPSQVRLLLDIGIRTVEDLAVANEEAIRRLGMGGRGLVTQAQNYLSAANNVGKHAERLTALQAENENLKVRNESLEEQVKMLAARMDGLDGGKAPAAALQGGTKL